MPHGYWDDISHAQRKALRILRDADGSRASELQFQGVSIATLRALHRFGLIRTTTNEIVQTDDAVYITESGKTSVEGEPCSTFAEKR